MPVMNMSQARIEMTAKQMLALIDRIHAMFAEPDQLPPLIWIEETNIEASIAVGGEDMPTALIGPRGELMELMEFVSHNGQAKGGIHGINSVRCPECGAAVGEACKSSSGQLIKGWHKLRTRAAR